MKKSFLYIILISILCSCNIEVRTKQEIELGVLPKLEDYFQCQCIRTYQEKNHLYLEIKDSPLITDTIFQGGTNNPDFIHHISMASIMISKSVEGTEMDTFHISISRKAGISTVTKSISGTISEHIDVYNKVETAFSFCRALSDSDFVKAEQLLNPRLLETFPADKREQLFKEFCSWGKLTDIRLKQYSHDLETNFLGVYLVLTFEESKTGNFFFEFPYNGPAHINGYKLIKDAVTPSNN
ncbi:MAG: hypothetical protein H6551_08965 [Chitinophagales bacterium]|nr:hypothetical protein [Chitinophagaceae bacterium]MCB9065252.1 hypothetical protein [Chitinophagales bacterium]